MENSDTDFTVIEKPVMRAMKRAYVKLGRHLDNRSQFVNDILESSKSIISKFAKCLNSEIYFTKSISDSNYLSILSLLEGKNLGKHIITSVIEPRENLELFKLLENQGFFVSYIPVDKEGIIDLDTLIRSINNETCLISITHTNIETGVIQPLEKIISICQSKNIKLHSDLSSSFGRIPLKVKDIDTFTFPSNEILGPKRLSVAIIKNQVSDNLISKYCLDFSTDNIALIAGVAKACKLTFSSMSKEFNRISRLRDNLVKQLSLHFDGIYFNGLSEKSSPYIINFCVKGLEGLSQKLLIDLNQSNTIFSAQTDCISEHNEPSHVLQAMGLGDYESLGAVRIILNRLTNLKETETIYNLLRKSLNTTKSLFSLI
ncbi:MAG: aminotransferase class V-fold PLP-dependent enzyme [Bacteroidales bacterium]|nr:aminotransferase class V-fold PLP-dependent enzyme [Bacteroidales bacterium]